MSDIAIHVENLGKRYQIGARQERPDTLRDALTGFFRRPQKVTKDETELWALKDVSFEVKRGEVVGIIGRNGAGKSTLLKILSRITEPTHGKALIHGRVGSLLEVGTGFHPELTGRENIYLSGAMLGMKREEIDRKFDEIVDFSGVEKFIDTPIKRYSSGMNVRLGFAVAAHLEPEILLVDEVLAVGDAVFQKKCLGKMGDVAQEGRTVLLVSHNMIAIQTLCQRAFWLNGGQLKVQGDVNSTVTNYLGTSLTGDGLREQVWADKATAPGNETVRLHRLAVTPDDGQADYIITMQTPLRIEIEYWNLLPDMYLHPTLHFINEQGIVAFTSSPGFDNPDPVLHQAPPIGLMRNTCYVPRGLLNSGLYRIAVFLVRGNMEFTCRLGELIGFEVIDNRERKFGWFSREPGTVQPSLEWKSHLL